MQLFTLVQKTQLKNHSVFGFEEKLSFLCTQILDQRLSMLILSLKSQFGVGFDNRVRFLRFIFLILFLDFHFRKHVINYKCREREVEKMKGICNYQIYEQSRTPISLWRVFFWHIAASSS